jgi:hypothetical protein
MGHIIRCGCYVRSLWDYACNAHQDDNLIEIPSQDGSEGVKALIQQLITWKPDTKGKTDCVMALWFCELEQEKSLAVQESVRVTYQTDGLQPAKKVLVTL